MPNISYQETTEKNREITMFTGQAGWEMFNTALQKHNDKDYAEYLCQSGKITKQEKERIITMIDSEDSENYELAKLILSNTRLKDPIYNPKNESLAVISEQIEKVLSSLKTP